MPPIIIPYTYIQERYTWHLDSILACLANLVLRSNLPVDMPLCMLDLPGLRASDNPPPSSSLPCTNHRHQARCCHCSRQGGSTIITYQPPPTPAQAWRMCMWGKQTKQTYISLVIHLAERGTWLIEVGSLGRFDKCSISAVVCLLPTLSRRWITSWCCPLAKLQYHVHVRLFLGEPVVLGIALASYYLKYYIKNIILLLVVLCYDSLLLF